MTAVLGEETQISHRSSEQSLCLPNFIYAGAPKAGSSSLYYYIRQHPDIYMSDVKEPFFFDFNYRRGIDWYARHFEAGRGKKIIGEATVWYMRWPGVPERMARHIPDAKFLFVLRNPIDRAWSNYWHDFQSGHYSPLTPFGYVIRNEEFVKKIDRTIVSAGFYYQHLKRFEEYFPRERFLILLFEDLKKDARAMARRVFEFLEVDPEFVPRTDERLMVTPAVRNYPLLNTAFRADSKLGTNLMPKLWRMRHFRQIMHAPHARKIKMDPTDREYLREVYREHNQQLAEYLGRDLSMWT